MITAETAKSRKTIRDARNLSSTDCITDLRARATRNTPLLQMLLLMFTDRCQSSRKKKAGMTLKAAAASTWLASQLNERRRSLSMKTNRSLFKSELGNNDLIEDFFLST